jgi:ADP-ribosylglycohydrolase
VLEALRRGDAPSQTGQLSAGTGAAMRIAPVALFYHAEPEAIDGAVMAASLITHRDCRSLAGAIAVAHAVRRLAAGAAREPSLLLRLAHDTYQAERTMQAAFSGQVAGLRCYAHSLSSAIAHVEKLLEIPRNRALCGLIEEANRHGPADACRRPTMGFAPALVPTCLYLLMTTDSFEEALIEAVNLGGDADTAGAILGAMAGASYGAAAIPERWLSRLQNREGIARRAEGLARGTAAGLEIPELVATEWELSRREGDRRARLIARCQNGGDLGANRRL